MSAINETIKQLEAQRASAEKEIAALTAAISSLKSLGTGAAPVTTIPAVKATPSAKPAKKGGMSAAGRARLVAALKARWAKIKAAKPAAKPVTKPAAKAAAKPKAVKPAKKPVISAAGIEKIRAAQKARWAAIKAAKAAAPTAA